jgi:hypothetical protein
MTQQIATTNQLPTVPNDNPWSDIADECGSKTLLKFVKGDWMIGEDTVPEGTQYIAFINDMARGYIRFNGEGEPPDVRIVKVSNSGVIQRETLGDLDKSEWETDKEGEPVDPWQLLFQLPLASMESPGEIAFYATSSHGGRSAIADLCGIYGRSNRNGMLPIVELRSTHYKHKEYSKVFKPILKLVSWYRFDEPVAGSLPSPSNPLIPSESDYGAEIPE